MFDWIKGKRAPYGLLARNKYKELLEKLELININIKELKEEPSYFKSKAFLYMNNSFICGEINCDFIDKKITIELWSPPVNYFSYTKIKYVITGAVIEDKLIDEIIEFLKKCNRIFEPFEIIERKEQ